MAMVSHCDLKSIAGKVITPADPAFDEARAVWNARVDHQPALIVCCANESDAATALILANVQGLPDLPG